MCLISKLYFISSFAESFLRHKLDISLTCRIRQTWRDYADVLSLQWSDGKPGCRAVAPSQDLPLTSQFCHDYHSSLTMKLDQDRLCRQHS
ncbi:hypothetical protein RRG08_012063 [Elysia crispata]|uniref:Uncharacterized protein n=1 Tax=Elysia crispata TaxID=231223 RepID=A0AAE1BDL5_9GAST|nr:hypothetical protein RRG08_012063 [Elysia crispata]